MDHEWGRNVSQEGLVSLWETLPQRPHGGRLLAARVSGTADRFFLLNVRAPDGRAYAARVPLFASVPYSFALFSHDGAHPHFPYGIAVTPDAPV